MCFGNFLISRKIKLIQLADIIVNDMNLIRNDVVIVHISLQNIKLIDSCEEDLLYFLKMVVGTGGTLVVPVYEDKYSKILNPGSPYCKKDAAQRNHIINGIFRKMPDAVEFILPSGSLYVWGKLSKWNSGSIIKSNKEIFKKGFPGKSYLLKSKIIGIGVPPSDQMFLYIFDYLRNLNDTLENSDQENNNDLNSDSNEVFVNDQYNISGILKPKSVGMLTDYFENDVLKVFSKRGITFFAINTEEFYNKMHLLLKNRTTIQKF